MSKADVWMPLYIADYLRKTMHLTRDQHGAYMLLLMACWDRGGRLPNDPGQLAAMARATPGEWRKLAPVIMPFFQIEGGVLVQGRVIEEHEKAARISEARRQAGLQGGRPKRAENESEGKANPEANAFAKPKQNETHAVVARPSPSQKDSVPDGTGAEPPLDDLEALRGLPIDTGAWRLGVKVLVDLGGKTDAAARAFVGKLKASGLSSEEIWRICEAAWQAQTPDPIPYLSAAAERVHGLKTGIAAPGLDRQRAWMGDFIENPHGWRPGDRGPRPGTEGCRVEPAVQSEFGVRPFGADLLSFPAGERVA